LKRIVYVLAALSLLYGCGGKAKMVVGTSREVLMVYSEDSKFSAGALYKYMVKILYTPQPETLIYVRPLKWERFSQYDNYRNKIIFLLPNDSLWDLCKEEEGVFFRKDMFLRGDFVVLVCSYDSRAMLRLVTDNLPVIWDTLLSKAIRELSEVEFLGGRNRKLMEAIDREFKIKMVVPAGWSTYRRGPNFFSLIKGNPSRFIFVYSEPYERFINLEDILNLRDSLTTVYYKGDSVAREYVTSMTDEVNGVQVFKVYGLWKNDTLMAGGPFVTYAFNKDGKFYMLDAGVFAPQSQNKVNLILRVEGIIRTFR
jgi:hypothetical protein